MPCLGVAAVLACMHAHAIAHSHGVTGAARINVHAAAGLICNRLTPPSDRALLVTYKVETASGWMGLPKKKEKITSVPAV